jgi:hypothetical protein
VGDILAFWLSYRVGVSALWSVYRLFLLEGSSGRCFGLLAFSTLATLEPGFTVGRLLDGQIPLL